MFKRHDKPLPLTIIVMLKILKSQHEDTSRNLDTATLEETVNKSFTENRSVYAYFLDLTKLLELVRYDVLFTKMQSKGVPSR